MKQTFQSEMFHGEALKKMAWRDGEEMWYRSIVDVYFIQKRPQLLKGRYDIFKSIGDPMSSQRSCWRQPNFLHAMTEYCLTD